MRIVMFFLLILDVIVQVAPYAALNLLAVAIVHSFWWGVGLYGAVAFVALVMRILLNQYGPEPVALPTGERLVLNVSFSLFWFYTFSVLNHEYIEKYRSGLVEEVVKAYSRWWRSRREHDVRYS